MKHIDTSQVRNSQTNLIMTAVSTAVVTILSFPVISYTSVVFYGLPAAAYILLGYAFWLLVMQSNRRMAFAFAIGFFPIVGFFLLGLLTAKPPYVGVILLPVACLCLVLRLRRAFRLR